MGATRWYEYRISRADFVGLFADSHQSLTRYDVIQLLGDIVLMQPCGLPGFHPGFGEALGADRMMLRVHQFAYRRAVTGDVCG